MGYFGAAVMLQLASRRIWRTAPSETKRWSLQSTLECGRVHRALFVDPSVSRCASLSRCPRLRTPWQEFCLLYGVNCRATCTQPKSVLPSCSLLTEGFEKVWANGRKYYHIHKAIHSAFNRIERQHSLANKSTFPPSNARKILKFICVSNTAACRTTQ